MATAAAPLEVWGRLPLATTLYLRGRIHLEPPADYSMTPEEWEAATDE
jgi:hypothetical protein